MGCGALKFFGIVDILLGVLVIGVQITYWVKGYTDAGIIVYASSGIWGGIIFIITGVYAYRKATKTSGMTVFSMVVGFVMIGLFAYGIVLLLSYPDCKYFDICNSFFIMTAILLGAGILAVLVNVVLLVLAKKLPSTSPHLHIQPNNMQQGNVLNPTTSHPAGNGTGVVYQVAQPSTAYSIQHQQVIHQQNPTPSYQTRRNN